MQETRRAVLDAVAAGPVTGPELASRLDVSRTAVWKHVDALRTDGFEVANTPDGYKLIAVPAYGATAIEFGLDAPFTIEYHDRVESTNRRARERTAAGDRDVVVVADEQTGGRGRLGREWSSPSGGIWFSILVRPDLPPSNAPVLTLAAGVAVASSLRDLGVDASIKWPNDVLVDDEKICGILTEMAGEADRVSWVIVGVGLNANVDPAALPDGATSLRALVGDVDRRVLVQSILETFTALLEDVEGVIPAWRSFAGTLGRRVRVETPTETIEGVARDVAFPGVLLVETVEGTRRVTVGDCEHLRPT